MKNTTLISTLIVVGLIFGFVGSASAYTSPSEEFNFLRYNGSCPATDFSGNNLEGECNGGVTTGADGVSRSSGEWDTGNAFVFDGTDDYLKIDKSSEDFQQISLSTWVRFDDLSSSKTVVGMTGPDAGNDGELLTYYPDNSEWKVRPRDNSNNFFDGTIEDTSISTGEIYHVVSTFDAGTGTAEVFVNGTSVGTDTTASISEVDTSTFWIGVDDESGQGKDTHMEGMIDETHLYGGKILSSSEISNLYQYNQLTEISDNPPSVSNVEYEVSGSWVSGSSLSFNDDVTRIRASISDPEGDSISSTSLDLTDLYDSNQRLTDVSHTSSSGDTYTFDVTDQVLDDSGDWETVIEATDSNGNTGSTTDSFSLTWGTLSASMSNPGSDTDVEQNDVFEMSGSASCSGGECASEGEKVELWADPVWTEDTVKMDSSKQENGLKPGENVKISGDYEPRTAGKDDILFVRGETDLQDSLEKQREADVEHSHTHGEETHTHSKEKSQGFVSKIFETFGNAFKVF